MRISGTDPAKLAPLQTGIDHRIGRLTTVTIAPLDFAALLCSRVCHDVISPVGAIVNGLEMLDSETDEDMRSVAMDLIKKSAASASARLQFCRLAFGAAGSLTASIDTGDAENVARGQIANDRTVLRWNASRSLLPKNTVKLLLNLCLIATSSIPRGGEVAVEFEVEGDAVRLRIVATGANARLPNAAAVFLTGGSLETVDGQSVQPYYTALLAKDRGMIIGASTSQELVTLTATPGEPEGSVNDDETRVRLPERDARYASV